MTLRRAGVDPARLVSTYQKMTRHEREHFPPGPRVDYYPPLADRKKFAAAVMAWAARQDPGVNEK